MTIHSNMPSWEMPWTEEAGGYSPQGRKELDRTELLNNNNINLYLNFKFYLNLNNLNLNMSHDLWLPC